MYYSINKLKCHMLFTTNVFGFSWSRKFWWWGDGGEGARAPCCPVSTTLIRITVRTTHIDRLHAIKI